MDENLSSSDLKTARSIFDIVENYYDEYISKFNIYCLYNQDKNEAQLLFDLKELGLKDKFFEKNLI